MSSCKQCAFWTRDAFFDRSRFYSLQGELILAMTYGYEVRGRDDRKIDVARRMSDLGSATALPGALLVNDLPFRM
jgi:hypothetical protein